MKVQGIGSIYAENSGTSELAPPRVPVKVGRIGGLNPDTRQIKLSSFLLLSYFLSNWALAGYTGPSSRRAVTAGYTGPSSRRSVTAGYTGPSSRRSVTAGYTGPSSRRVVTAGYTGPSSRRSIKWKIKPAQISARCEAVRPTARPKAIPKAGM